MCKNVVSKTLAGKGFDKYHVCSEYGIFRSVYPTPIYDVFSVTPFRVTNRSRYPGSGNENTQQWAAKTVNLPCKQQQTRNKNLLEMNIGFRNLWRDLSEWFPKGPAMGLLIRCADKKMLTKKKIMMKKYEWEWADFKRSKCFKVQLSILRYYWKSFVASNWLSKPNFISSPYIKRILYILSSLAGKYWF